MLPVLILLQPGAWVGQPPYGALTGSHSPARSRPVAVLTGRGAFAPSPFGWLAPAQPEKLYEGSAHVDFLLERVHLTKRRVSGGIHIDAAPPSIWRTLTDFEAMPEIIPNILSNTVTRRADGTVSIDQTSLLSRRLNLETEMTLEAVVDPGARRLELRRTGGHGFLEFVATYSLQPQPSGGTYLKYAVSLVPCPIFPLPLVEQKIRREVPKMLVAVRDAAQSG